ncbi:UL16-binding protein 1-like [Ovis canadensis]|uniref:UL16-binding protein 1-like n=1 Tax=Ovis canadensis TaxID=37174 RepID=UPI003752047B
MTGLMPPDLIRNKRLKTDKEQECSCGLAGEERGFCLGSLALLKNWDPGGKGRHGWLQDQSRFAFDGLVQRNVPDAHFLSYNFTIDPRPRDDQPWCEVQGEVDQKVFLSYDCGRAKVKYLSPLGEELKSMSTWETQTVTLRSGPLTLQARMTCWRESNGHTSVSWEFGFNGQLCLLFDSKNGSWTMVHPGGRQMNEKWENDRAVTDFFRTVSMGDCQAWLQDFMVSWEQMLKTSASPTTGPPTVQPTATASKHTTWILPSFIITVFLC